MSSMLRVAAVAAAIAVLVPCAAFARDLTVSSTVGFAKGANVPPKVKEGCNLQTIVPEAIANASSQVTLVEGRGTLQLEIIGLRGPGGGTFSGAKWLEVTGKISGGPSFRAKRRSTVDLFRGTCGMLAKCARAIGADVAVWLENPTDGAKLGEAR